MCLRAYPAVRRVKSVPAYVSINPALFESAEHWSYRDLQRLAKRINLPAAGRREQLVERLVAWHRAQRSSDQPGKFHSVEVRASPAGKPISPRLMSPLVQRNLGTNGILAVGGSNTPREDVEPRSPRVPRSATKQNGVVFSPVRSRCAAVAVLSVVLASRASESAGRAVRQTVVR